MKDQATQNALVEKRLGEAEVKLGSIEESYKALTSKIEISKNETMSYFDEKMAELKMFLKPPPSSIDSTMGSDSKFVIHEPEKIKISEFQASLGTTP